MTTNNRRCKFCDVLIVSKRTKNRPAGSKFHGGKGYCATHYNQLKDGRPLTHVTTIQRLTLGEPCNHCDKPMVPGRTPKRVPVIPDGWAEHVARRLCMNCYQQAKRLGMLEEYAKPKRRTLQLTEQEAWTTTLEKPLSDEMMSRLSGFSPEIFAYMVGRRRRGIPAIGVGQTTPKQQQAGAA